MPKKEKTAILIILSIPYLTTRVPFINVADPIDIANPAKINGNSSLSPYWVWNICCDALKYTIKDPVINPEITVYPIVCLCLNSSLTPSIAVVLVNFTRYSGCKVSG